MRIILSRKGMDSGAGGIASPILPDGTLLSLPIPEKSDNEIKTTYKDLLYNRKCGEPVSYSDIINGLSGTLGWENKKCHVDPDLVNRCSLKVKEWKPAFGQYGASQSHLKNNYVGIKPENEEIQDGDLFLFYGWFRHAEEYIDNEGKVKYRYINEGANDSCGKHVIWGYMQVKDVVVDLEKIKAEYGFHPHAKPDYINEKNNAIYIPTDTLSFDPEKRGCGVFRYDFTGHVLDLTSDESGCSRSHWDLHELGEWIQENKVQITYHGKGGRLGYAGGTKYFQSARRGQEFIIKKEINLVSDSKASIWLRKIMKQAL